MSKRTCWQFDSYQVKIKTTLISHHTQPLLYTGKVGNTVEARWTHLSNSERSDRVVIRNLNWASLDEMAFQIYQACHFCYTLPNKHTSNRFCVFSEKWKHPTDFIKDSAVFWRRVWHFFPVAPDERESHCPLVHDSWYPYYCAKYSYLNLKSIPMCRINWIVKDVTVLRGIRCNWTKEYKLHVYRPV